MSVDFSTDYFYDDCNPPVRVLVAGKEIPVINSGVETQCRIDGPMDINMSSEVYFPAEWEGEDVLSTISAFDDDEDVWQPVDIQYIDPESDPNDPEYVTYHRGFPHRYGPGSKDTLEYRLNVGDMSMLLNGIPFTGSYGNDATLGDILDDAIGRFEEEQSVVDFINLQHIDTEDVERFASDHLEGDTIETDGVIGTLWDYISPSSNIDRATTIAAEFGVGSQVSFNSNEDTVMDAINYVTERLDGELYFAPSEYPNQISLIYDEDRSRDFTAGDMYSDGPTVVKNNALYEIQPINTVEVHGSPRNSYSRRIESALQGDVSGDQTYPTAKAVHSDLRSQSGMELKPPIQSEPEKSPSEVRKKAREMLIDEIEGGGMGEVQLELFPHIYPHDSITAPPGCGQNIDRDVSPITYTVDSITHRVGWEEERFVKRTLLRVNTHVTTDDIGYEISEESLEDHE